MTKNLIIASESSKLFTTQRLLIEGKKLKYSTTWFNPYESSLAGLKNYHKSSLYFLRTSGVRYDDFDLLTAQNFSLNNYNIKNSIESCSLFRNKDWQYLYFREHKINCIPSFMYRGTLQLHDWETIQKLSPNGDYVLKMNRGNQGVGVNLIHGHQSLISFLETFHAIKDQRFLIQPLIPHKKELRLFIIKNEIHAIVERTISENDFRGNAKRSNAKLLTKIPKVIQDEVLKATKLSKLDYCGVDVIITKDEFLILEINPVPGFEQVESLSKKNIARELILQLQ
jgi:ribosomal protein S6--L-glutamate ligase